MSSEQQQQQQQQAAVMFVMCTYLEYTKVAMTGVITSTAGKEVSGARPMFNEAV